MTDERTNNPLEDGDEPYDWVAAVAGFCRDLTAGMQFELNAEACLKDGIITVNLSGSDRALLLSNAATLLNSIEYLANKVFHTGKDEEILSITLDSDNYRRHREAELCLLAEMAAKKVIAQGRPLILQPMVPRERRIIHLALGASEGVRTESEGEGDHRCITIYPA